MKRSMVAKCEHSMIVLVLGVFRGEIIQRPAAMTFSNFIEYEYVYSNAASETHGSGAADEKV